MDVEADVTIHPYQRTDILFAIPALIRRVVPNELVSLPAKFLPPGASTTYKG